MQLSFLMLRTTAHFVRIHVANYMRTSTCHELHRMNTTCYEIHRIYTTCYELHRINSTCYVLNRIKTTCYEASCRKFESEYSWAWMNGKVGSTYRRPAASCAFGGYRLLANDGWKSQCNVPPSGSKLRLKQLHLGHLPSIEHRMGTPKDTKWH